MKITVKSSLLLRSNIVTVFAHFNHLALTFDQYYDITCETMTSCIRQLLYSSLTFCFTVPPPMLSGQMVIFLSKEARVFCTYNKFLAPKERE